MPFNVSPRLRSKSFVGRDIICFNILPNELLLDIVELAGLEGSKTILELALVCKRLSQLVDAVLYRTIILSSPESIFLLHATVQSRHASFFASHVKKLAVTYSQDTGFSQLLQRGPNKTGKKLQEQLAQIMDVCTGLRTLAVPLCPTPLTSEEITSSVSPTEIILGTYADLAPEPFMFGYSSIDPAVCPVNYNEAIFQGVSHLRVGDPSDGWYSPLSMMTSFGPVPHLTHFQLSRRANANVDNDDLFVSEIREILQSRKDLKMLVAAIYPSNRRSVKDTDDSRPLADDIRDSSILSALRKLALEDDRLVAVDGAWGGWVREWEDPKVVVTGNPGFDYWRSATRRARALSSA